MISYAQFSQYILPFTLRWEGGYANDPDDSGGETYRGISRNNNPAWQGWKVIDKVKPLAFNQTLAAVDYYVNSYYFAKYFEGLNLHYINNTKVALACFDFAVHGGFTHAKVKNLLKQKYFRNAPTTTAYFAAINSVNPDSLASDIITLREQHLKDVILRDPVKKKYEKGWFNRITALRAYLNLAAIGSGLGAILVIGILLYVFKDKIFKYDKVA